jgi:hypothetical protein
MARGFYKRAEVGMPALTGSSGQSRVSGVIRLDLSRPWMHRVRRGETLACPGACKE